MNADPAAFATDTIAACATAPGPAALAVIRVSGPQALKIAASVAGPGLVPRRAMLRAFRDRAGNLIDRGIALFFPAPASFTGEDVVELQCHGGRIVTEWLLAALFDLGARPAEPGEFSQRAFLNDRLDLTQAEAIADLITSGSRRAAQAALRSLDGDFAAALAPLQAALTELRVLCEAWLDFPEEELDRAAAANMAGRAGALDRALADLSRRAAAGLVLNDGLAVAIAGEPNAGKSSLMNRLAGTDAAIVSPIPGTTRDTVERHATLGGIPIQLIDTAGLRESGDVVEKEGVTRAQRAIGRADMVLWVAEVTAGEAAALAAARRALPPDSRFLLVLNKVDLCRDAAAAPPVTTVIAAPTAAVASVTQPRRMAGIPAVTVRVSALTGAGIAALVDAIVASACPTAEVAGTFSARRRHLSALARARDHVLAAEPLLRDSLELAAEELRSAQTALSELTGTVSSDDLLGAVFSTFCIGK